MLVVGFIGARCKWWCSFQSWVVTSVVSIIPCSRIQSGFILWYRRTQSVLGTFNQCNIVFRIIFACCCPRKLMSPVCLLHLRIGRSLSVGSGVLCKLFRSFINFPSAQTIQPSILLMNYIYSETVTTLLCISFCTFIVINKSVSNSFFTWCIVQCMAVPILL